LPVLFAEAKKGAHRLDRARKSRFGAAREKNSAEKGTMSRLPAGDFPVG
jgi:hypothetical protein